MKRRRVVLAAIACVFAAVASVAATKIQDHQEEVSQASYTRYSNAESTEIPRQITREDLLAISFADVSGTGPKQSAVRYVAYQGIMQGTGDGNFQPDGFVTRAAIVSILQRAAEKTVELSHQENLSPMAFTDVALDAWYADAVDWAARAGIITGNENGTFAPDERITRAQLAVMLYRYANYIGCDLQVTGNLSAYEDGSGVAAYAQEPLAWAMEKGLFDAVVSDTIYPELPVSRVQVAQMLVPLIAITTQEPLAMQLAAEDSLEAEVSASRLAHAEIQAAVDSAASKYGAVGVQVAVIENGKVTDAFAAGWATKDVDPMTAYHRMRVASISKVLVGLETVRLWEQGKVDLDAPIGTYWGVCAKNPYYPDVPVSIRTLLSHTSSISNLGDDASRSYSAVRSRLAGSSGYSHTKPGDISSWTYNNYAFGVLGMTAELAADQCMNTLLRQDLFDIMQVDGAFSAGDLENNSRLVTLTYHDGSVARSAASQRSLHAPTTPGASGAYFAGGLVISAVDLGKIVALLANDGVYEGLQLIQPESVALMETKYETALSDGSYQALPLRYQPGLYGRSGLYYHTGSAFGVYNCISYDPSTGDGVVVLTVGASGTKDDRGIYAICGEISNYVYSVTK